MSSSPLVYRSSRCNHAQCPKAQQQINPSWIRNIQSVSKPERRVAIKEAARTHPESESEPSPAPCARVIKVLRSHDRNPAHRQLSSKSAEATWAPDILLSGLWSRLKTRADASTYASRPPSDGKPSSPHEPRDLPPSYRIPEVRAQLWEWRRTTAVAARFRVYWFPFSWASVSTHTRARTLTHRLHLQLHRPPWACEAAGCDAKGISFLTPSHRVCWKPLLAAHISRRITSPVTGDEFAQWGCGCITRKTW